MTGGLGDFKAHILCADLAGPAFAGSELVVALRAAGYRATLDTARWGGETIAPDIVIADIRGHDSLTTIQHAGLAKLADSYPGATFLALTTFSGLTQVTLPASLDCAPRLITTDAALDNLLFHLDT